jgi:hypothetical protein
MNGMTASYSPEDNKIRIYPTSRLDPETYAKVKAAGFKWAPKQELFIAPMWTPEREDLAIELCGELGDEDTSLVERAEERAGRFDEYGHNRANDAQAAHAAVSAIADNIPLGQPIICNHHSEAHARRDAKKIENGMRKAVRMWEQSQYWKDRAAGALRAAKYKELPNVRARRIKGLEADKRKQEKHVKEYEKLLKFWSLEEITREQALKVSNYFDHLGTKLPDGTEAWSLWGALDENRITLEDARAQRLEGLPKLIAHHNRWLSHIENRLEYERAMMEESGGTASDRTKPEKGEGCWCWASPRGGWSYIQKVNKVSVTVLDRWTHSEKPFTRTIPFDKLAGVMSAEEVSKARTEGRLRESADGLGFFIHEAPTPTEGEEKNGLEFPDHAVIPPEVAVFDDSSKATSQQFEKMRESLRQGIKVVDRWYMKPE